MLPLEAAAKLATTPTDQYSTTTSPAPAFVVSYCSVSHPNPHLLGSTSRRSLLRLPQSRHLGQWAAWERAKHAGADLNGSRSIGPSAPGSSHRAASPREECDAATASTTSATSPVPRQSRNTGAPAAASSFLKDSHMWWPGGPIRFSAMSMPPPNAATGTHTAGRSANGQSPAASAQQSSQELLKREPFWEICWANRSGTSFRHEGRRKPAEADP